MWFTRVSLKNPVFATMVMLAIVVLGLFSYQRLNVDQFPNIDFPVVVVQTEYPGASPEIVESEVSKKVEEAVNSIAGINALTSRSYEGLSLVVIEFQLYVDGRKAAEDVREKIAAVRPTFRDEVKEPRVLRFDPASRPIWSLAVLPDASKGTRPLSAVELTNWADQVLKKRLENVRGVGSVTLVGGTKREINIYLNPPAMEALGITADQVVSAVRSENQDLPVGAIRSRRRNAWCRSTRACSGRRTSARSSSPARTRGAAPVRVDQVARVPTAARKWKASPSTTASAPCCCRCRRRRTRTPSRCTTAWKTLEEMQAQLPPACSWSR
jgi:HAE1 family hydrophobic/amphiphilic exporter-1